MAWVQNARIPANNKLEFNLSNFAGGLNNRSNIIQEHESSNLLNMHFTYHDVMEKRVGFDLFDEVKLNAPITHLGLYRPYRDEDKLMRATDTALYIGAEKLIDTQGEIDAVNYQGMYLFCDGDSLYAYGEHTTVTGTYTKVVGTHPGTYAVLKVVNPPEGYTPLEKIHSQGVTVYDYTAGTVHYEPCLHELEDVYLGVNLLPEHPRFIEVFKGRLFISGDRKDDDNVFITDINAPFYFAVSMPIQLPPNSDKVRGMIVYDDNIIVGREHDLYRISGETSNPQLGFELFQLRKINSHTGIANNKTLTEAHNYLFFLGSDGVAYALTTVRMDERLVSTQILSNQLDLFKAPINVTREEMLRASACYDQDYWYLNIGDKTLVYSYRHKAWTMFDYIDMHASTYHFDKVIWGRRDGTVAKWGTGFTDNGRPIMATWESMAFDMGAPTRQKQFREFYLVAHAYDDTDSTIRLTFEVDYANVLGESIVENRLSIWGESEFGDLFIDRNIHSSVPFMIGRRARNLRIRFTNGYSIDAHVPDVLALLDIPRKYDYMGAWVDETQSYHYYYRGKWTELTAEQINQPMRVYTINGDYEMKGKR